MAWHQGKQTESQILGILKESEAGIPLAGLTPSCAKTRPF